MKTEKIKYQVQLMSETETEWTPFAAEYQIEVDAITVCNNNRKTFPKHKFRAVRLTTISEVLE